MPKTKKNIKIINELKHFKNAIIIRKGYGKTNYWTRVDATEFKCKNIITP
jgi:hypothetical protein